MTMAPAHVRSFCQAGEHFFGTNTRPLQALAPVFQALDQHGIYPLCKSVDFLDFGPNTYRVFVMATDFAVNMTLKCAAGQAPYFAGECWALDRVPVQKDVSFERLDPTDPVDVQGWANEVVGWVNRYQNRGKEL